jgi:nicotinamide-nucleotide amidase
MALFSDALLTSANRCLERLTASGAMLVCAESCTGGLLTGLLTEIAGSSRVVERGFVTYSNAAKTEALGVPAALIERHGAVSREVVMAMAAGALAHSPADIAAAVTGVAGPDGGTAEKPVGLVYVAARRRGHAAIVRELRLGNIGRSEVRLATLAATLALIEEAAG